MITLRNVSRDNQMHWLTLSTYAAQSLPSHLFLLRVSLTVACGRSRFHHRSQMSDSRNIHCTFWPEIRRCRWSALSPPWQSRLPGLIASEADLAKQERTPGEKDALFLKPGWYLRLWMPHLFRCILEVWESFCRPTHLRSCEQSDRWPMDSIYGQTEKCKWSKLGAKKQAGNVWGGNIVGDEEIGLQQWT